jgi:pimeloyl-ACP methyl ester carboxylesterase
VGRQARKFAIAVLIALLILMLFENRFIYFPTTAAEEWLEPADLPHQDVTLVLSSGADIHAWWCPRPGADSALLYCHGNAGNLSHRAPTYRKLQDELNVSIMAFDYPGYGKSTGTPNEVSCCGAGECAFNWVSQEGHIPAERIILFGESLGGGVATDLASRYPCRALVLFRTFASVPAVAREVLPFLPTGLLMRNRFDNVTKLHSIHCPVFIGHGDADTLISPHHAQRLYETANEPKLLFWEANTNHNEPMTPEFRTALRQFLGQHAP